MGSPAVSREFEHGLGTLKRRQALGVLGSAFIGETRFAARRRCQTS